MPHSNYLLCCFFLLLSLWAKAQPYSVHYRGADSVISERLQLTRKFTSRPEAESYLNNLPTLLQAKGYIASSVDNISYDSVHAEVQLYLGERFQWARISTKSKDEDFLQAIHWPARSFSNNGFDFPAFQAWQEKLMNYMEESGYPFARIYLDSISIQGNDVAALLQIDRGPLYMIDSIRINGNVKISKEFLEHYLEIPRKSIYNKKKLQAISQRLKQLTYIEEVRPSTVTMLSTGSILDLYLKPKKSSQLNVLAGFMPNSNPNETKRFLITGEANVLLRNSLGAGETIGLNWQQLQAKSPRLNLLYDHPFVFNSPVGFNFTFDMYRKDSTFLNLNMQVGGNYMVSATQSASVFLQKRQSILSAIDTTLIKQSKRLPQQADVSSNNLGVAFLVNTTNYRFNPLKGAEFYLSAAAGIKKIKKNNQILELKDPSFNYESLYDTAKLKTHQVRVIASAAKYFPVGRQSALKTGINAGVFQSGNYFLNELFQVGGYKLLRGFTEESEYLAQYAIGTLEYRYLIGLNSNFFGFIDGGWGRNPLQEQKNHSYIGTGLGMAFETKAGIFNLVWAIGKRNDTELNLRQSKVHLGFVNYF
ncbi:BamA/TamA family outer membrane protein [Chitinophagaceae bacterium LB-8]|uniref:BamA/TamA family outer membrane protein n=1 Tax=Paraflavisolibacter caeni TaxID=2982496 RepID=A0A9X2XNL3_9BACT|nr:POTRA domain-containing protein [Paraflavisolibacter caeni]MCU7548519.1 BamA/TamA family outer membrane protein [Paraflavisolibacter caeni]